MSEIIAFVAYHNAGKKDYQAIGFTNHADRRAFRKAIGTSAKFQVITVPCEQAKAIKLRFPEIRGGTS